MTEQSIRAKTEQALSQARSIGGRDRLNCIAELDPTALEQAAKLEQQGCAAAWPFLGIPVLVKDNIDVKDLHTTAGSLALANHVAASDAPVIRNLRRNGAVILGKTNMTEFANYTTQGMPNGYSSRGGQVIHATNPALSPSGSSSGSAVAVAAGIVPAAVGTDTSFSILACAQENGVCGLKPPVGALPWAGIIPIAHTLDSAGPLATNMSDTLRLYSAMRDKPLPEICPALHEPIRMAVNIANHQVVSEAQRSFLQDTMALLKQHGASVDEVRQMPSPYQSVIMQWEFKPHLEEYLRASHAPWTTLAEIVAYYEAHPQTMMKYGITLLKKALEETPGGLESPVYLEALEERSKAILQARQLLKDYDAVVMTGPTNIMHFCGFPAVTIVGKQKNKYGVPRGLILYGVDEYRLYQAALTLEAYWQEKAENADG